MDGSLEITPIGYVSSPVTERTDTGWGAVVARVCLAPEFAGALDGLGEFSHAIVVTWLHEARFDAARHLRRRPQGRDDMPMLGILAQRAKDRPNPIGVTAVAIVEVGEQYIDVKGLDAIDGTPVLDVKPYYPHYDRVENPTVPEWVQRLMRDYF